MFRSAKITAQSSSKARRFTERNGTRKSHSNHPNLLDHTSASYVLEAAD